MSGTQGILNISFEFAKKVGTRQLPELTKEYESTVKGLYIVGDLADAPVIKIALNQGYDIAKKIAAKPDAKAGEEGVLDVAIVGAGPSGIGAALAFKEAGLKYRVIERERPFNTIQNYPKHKHVFAEPRPVMAKASLWFEDALKEDLVGKWEEALDREALDIAQPVEVVDIQRRGGGFVIATKNVESGEKGELRAKRVMLCIGRRGTVRKMGVPGEDLDKVAYALGDPDKFRGRNVAVIGGGDSAVEAMLALCEHNKVVAIHRGDDFTRCKPDNRRKVDAAIAAGRITPHFKAKMKEVREDAVVFTASDQTIVAPNDDVFALIGTELPLPFLQKIGVKMEGSWDGKRITWLVCSMIIAYLFYAMKESKAWFPFTPKIHAALNLHALGRDFGGGFWGTVIYSLVVTVFGLQAMRRYPSKHQKRRFLSLILSQWFLLFIIPEFIVPVVLRGFHASTEIVNNSWRAYGIVLPWPLFTYNVDAPMKWLVASGFVAFILIPLVAIFHGKRFCTWVCGCGGLAETLGDRWRHLAPKSDNAKKLEGMGSIILIVCAVMSALIVADTLHFAHMGGFQSVKAFKQNWYDLAVDFWLSGAIPVGLYPIFGGKIWCRFWCPLAKYMQIVSKYLGRLEIKSNEHCIGCGQCTRYCQVGIDVQSFAQRGKSFSNQQTSCIQCGICIEVCPMEVLSFGKRSEKLKVLPAATRPEPRKIGSSTQAHG